MITDSGGRTYSLMWMQSKQYTDQIVKITDILLIFVEQLMISMLFLFVSMHDGHKNSFYIQIARQRQILHKDRFWTEHATNLWWQKSNKCHTESAISDNVGNAVRNMTKSFDIPCQQIDDRNRTEFIEYAALAGIVGSVDRSWA